MNSNSASRPTTRCGNSVSCSGLRSARAQLDKVPRCGVDSINGNKAASHGHSSSTCPGRGRETFRQLLVRLAGRPQATELASAPQSRSPYDLEACSHETPPPTASTTASLDSPDRASFSSRSVPICNNEPVQNRGVGPMLRDHYGLAALRANSKLRKGLARVPTTNKGHRSC